MLWVDYNNYLLKYYYDYDMMLIKYSINLGLLLKMRNQSRRSPLSPYNSEINSNIFEEKNMNSLVKILNLIEKIFLST